MECCCEIEVYRSLDGFHGLNLFLILSGEVDVSEYGHMEKRVENERMKINL